ncbi:recombinase family protein [Streptomyces sp. NPDC048650]|uniref:recombinase family protein n=1 Tax=unclassified Streptomyces TaxID=2593676 RepID=UPI003716D803
MTVDRAPLVFVHDRCATRNHRDRDMRLTGCHNWADSHGWVLAGRWLDLGDHALGAARPQLYSLIAAMRGESERREVLCLVHNWSRLAHDTDERLEWQRRIAQDGGGWTATTFGESDRRYRAAPAQARRAADP